MQSDITEQKRTEEALQAANRKLEAAAERLKKDFEAAAALQRALLPEALPQVPGVNLAWSFRPCQELAGDTLNVFLLDHRRLALYILDVSGHGVASSLLSFTLSHLLSPTREKSALYQAVGDGSGTYHALPPADVVARLNKQFPFNRDLPQFFTIAYGILDLETRTLRYVSAGHLDPMYVPAGEPPRIAAAGSSPPVGLFPNPRYEEQVLELKPGDRVYLSTDGVIEAENSEGQEFGLARLVDALDRYRNTSLAEALASVMASAQQWCAPSAFADDVSMLALEISGASG